MGRKRKHITEYEIVDELMKLEAEIFRVLKNTPKKYQFDLAQQTFDQLIQANKIREHNLLTKKSA